MSRRKGNDLATGQAEVSNAGRAEESARDREDAVPCGAAEDFDPGDSLQEQIQRLRGQLTGIEERLARQEARQGQWVKEISEWRSWRQGCQGLLERLASSDEPTSPSAQQHNRPVHPSELPRFELYSAQFLSRSMRELLSEEPAGSDEISSDSKSNPEDPSSAGPTLPLSSRSPGASPGASGSQTEHARAWPADLRPVLRSRDVEESPALDLCEEEENVSIPMPASRAGDDDRRPLPDARSALTPVSHPGGDPAEPPSPASEPFGGETGCSEVRAAMEQIRNLANTAARTAITTHRKRHRIGARTLILALLLGAVVLLRWLWL